MPSEPNSIVGRASSQPCVQHGVESTTCAASGRVPKSPLPALSSQGLAATCCDLPPCGAPTLSITTQDPLVIRRSTEASVEAVASLGLCDAGTDAVSMTWSWTCDDSSVDLGETSSSSQLRVPAYTFAPGASVVLTVTAHLSSIPSDTATATITVARVAAAT